MAQGKPQLLRLHSLRIRGLRADPRPSPQFGDDGQRSADGVVRPRLGGHVVHSSCWFTLRGASQTPPAWTVSTVGDSCSSTDSPRDQGGRQGGGVLGR
jgi:hypothetical protein